MKFRIELSLSWWLSALLALLCAACTTTHGAQGGTETGNPPVIDASLISLIVSQDEVHVRGKPGAVTPGAEIEVTSALTGAVFFAQAASDGSFDVRVDTPITDSFEVRATFGGQSSSVVRVVRGGASVGDGDAGEGDASAGGGEQALSCSQRGQMAQAQMSATAASADTQCERDQDCVFGRAHTLCSDSCYDRPVSIAGAQALEGARAAIESGLCKDFVADGCQRIALPCLPGRSEPVGCRDRRCQLVEPDSQPDAGAPPDAGVAACPAQVPLRGSACSGTLSCDYGHCVLDWSEQATCVGGKWTTRSFNCWTSSWGPLRTADCTSPFDVGGGDASIPVYWYYPQVGVCLQRTYGGLEGNDNRYETLAGCEAACSRAGACPPNRVETEICVEPGPAGGCARRAMGCALLCAEPGQPCAGEPAGWWCTPRGLCEGSAAE